jgi:hypothetical protein
MATIPLKKPPDAKLRASGFSWSALSLAQDHPLLLCPRQLYNVSTRPQIQGSNCYVLNASRVRTYFVSETKSKLSLIMSLDPPVRVFWNQLL